MQSTDRNYKDIVLSLIMINRNGERLLRYTLRPIVRILEKYDWVEFVFVDDASSDNSLSLVRKTLSMCKSCQYTIYSLRERKGPSYARNVGALLSRGSILFFIDNDTILLSDDVVVKIREVFEHMDDVTIVQPYVEPFFNGSVVWGGGGFVTPSSFGYVERSCVEEPFYALGAALAIRRDVFFAVDGFNPLYDYLYEEVSLAWKTRRISAGRVYCIPDARVAHISRGSGSNKKASLFIRNRFILLMEVLELKNFLIFGSVLGVRTLYSKPLELIMSLIFLLKNIKRIIYIKKKYKYNNKIIFKKFIKIINLELALLHNKNKVRYLLTKLAYRLTDLNSLLSSS